MGLVTPVAGVTSPSEVLKKMLIGEVLSVNKIDLIPSAFNNSH